MYKFYILPDGKLPSCEVRGDFVYVADFQQKKYSMGFLNSWPTILMSGYYNIGIIEYWIKNKLIEEIMLPEEIVVI